MFGYKKVATDSKNKSPVNRAMEVEFFIFVALLIVCIGGFMYLLVHFLNLVSQLGISPSDILGK